jgi:hypothetical protein
MPPDDSGAWSRGGSFHDILNAAINDILATGYISAEQIAAWVTRIKEAALRSLTPPHVLQEHLNATMRAIFRNKVENGGILKFHPGLPRFKLEQIAPRLRAEVDRRIMASAGLIKLNRQEAIETTLRRFSGWSTSIPPGGVSEETRRKVKEEIRKPLASLSFRERRVAIDQGTKLARNLSGILAVDGSALGGHWRSHFNQQNYDFRPAHKHFDVDDKFFVVRDNWAIIKGLMKVDGCRYTDEIEAPGQLPYCRCYYVWAHSLRGVPKELLTVKGRGAVEVRLAA